MIFTFIWAFERQEDWVQVHKYYELYKNAGAEVHFVELQASLQVRLRRNPSQNRLMHKPSKRNIQFSTEQIISDD